MKHLLILAAFISVASNASAQQSTHALKYDFFTPVAGCFGFSYEQPRNNFVSFDYDAGFIGVRLDDYFERDQFAGGYAAFGPRLYFKKDPADLNDFRGFYFKPQLLASYFSYTDSVDYYDYLTGLYNIGEEKGSDFSVSLLATLGTQFILSDLIVFDLWFGLGYGGSWVNETSNVPDTYYYETYNNAFKYSHVRFGDSPLIFDGGLSIGFKW